MPGDLLTLALCALAALALVLLAALRGWQGWLALRHREIDLRAAPDAQAPGEAAWRIELADLRERVRRLEAIAAGVDP
ncbi:MAG TPA: hypothetical protein PKD92_07545 [Novosphingobium sp.]|nr:hypothetical protein [Novosphingobium sp.]HMP56410.1 hypothetical protein [Novosphingobium sp.]